MMVWTTCGNYLAMLERALGGSEFARGVEVELLRNEDPIG
jgi:hypothetical protein